jgi:hypothetical protein
MNPHDDDDDDGEFTFEKIERFIRKKAPSRPKKREKIRQKVCVDSPPFLSSFQFPLASSTTLKHTYTPFPSDMLNMNAFFGACV